MKYYAIIYINKVITFIENPDTIKSIAQVAKDFLATSLNLEVNKIKVKELTFDEYCYLLNIDEKTNIEFNDQKIQQTKFVKQNQEFAEAVDWRYEPILEDYYSDEEIQKIIENREHILYYGLENLPHVISSKYKVEIKEVDVKTVLHEVEASDAKLVDEVLNE